MALGIRFGVSGSRFRVWGFRVWGLRFGFSLQGYVRIYRYTYEGVYIYIEIYTDIDVGVDIEGSGLGLGCRVGKVPSLQKLRRLMS